MLDLATLWLPTGVRHRFAFGRGYRLPALAFGITPKTAHASIDARELRVRFGPWRLTTPITNIDQVNVTGDFAYLKTVGPAHLSFTDHGVTFATNGDKAVCVTFHEPVRVLDPTGRLLLHPGATMTVEDPVAFADELRRATR